jgi:hypothetical protein
MIFSAIKIFGWTVPLLEFSAGPAVGVRLWWSNWFLVGVHPKNIYCVLGTVCIVYCLKKSKKFDTGHLLSDSSAQKTNVKSTVFPPIGQTLSIDNIDDNGLTSNKQTILFLCSYIHSDVSLYPFFCVLVAHISVLVSI